MLLPEIRVGKGFPTDKPLKRQGTKTAKGKGMQKLEGLTPSTTPCDRVGFLPLRAEGLLFLAA
jgi:hypothetical protein